VNSIVACCHSAKLCAYAARAFPIATIAFWKIHKPNATRAEKIPRKKINNVTKEPSREQVHTMFDVSERMARQKHLTQKNQVVSAQCLYQVKSL